MFLEFASVAFVLGRVKPFEELVQSSLVLGKNVGLVIVRDVQSINYNNIV